MVSKCALMFIFFIFYLINTGSSQKITIAEYKIILPNMKPPCQDTLTEYTRDNKKLMIIIMDCMGKMHVKVYKNGKLLEEGNYVNSLDTLKRYVYRTALGGGKKEITVGQYFEPLRNGVWLFYNQKGGILKKVNYINGVEAE